MSHTRRALRQGVGVAYAMVKLAAGPGDTLTVATENVGHLGRFVPARPWDQIAP